MLTHDNELRERYTDAWINIVRSRARARLARRRGAPDDLAELEIARYQGRAAAAVWLRGASPVSPVTGVAVALTAAQVARELQAAEDLALGPDLYVGELPDSYEGDPRWAAGIAEVLRWHLSRLPHLSDDPAAADGRRARRSGSGRQALDVPGGR